MICKLITELIQYGRNEKLIAEDDVIYTTNKLLELFGVEEYDEPAKVPEARPVSEARPISEARPVSEARPIPEARPVSEILEDLLSYAEEAGILKDATAGAKDLFDTKIMGLITPPPSVVRREFREKLDISPRDATEYYYSFCKATNYIRVDRIKKDERWTTETPFGLLDISINLSKPEKDPRDIAAAGKAKKSGYPACLLCKENEGYAGHISHPARQNHRIIPIELCGEAYFLQYSPYVYYNEHCIVFNDKHIPMKIDRAVFRKLLDFTAQFPHYAIGSNADLPIVGGSILSHDHFQGGCYEFPMVRAPYESEFTVPGFESVHAGVIKWPLTTIRLQSEDSEKIAELSDRILTKWRSYTDKDAFIFSETEGVPHNTITPIARRRGSLFELDLVLRNNITTEEHPLGVYHPHSEYHHIKKENIGLIEVMGLAILPSRLKKEMSELKEAILSGRLTEETLSAVPGLESHASWAAEFINRHGITADNLDSFRNVNGAAGSSYNNLDADSSDSDRAADSSDSDRLAEIIRDEIGLVFSHVLEDAGVYKCTEEGRHALNKFIETI